MDLFTLVLLNKLRCHTHFWLSANQITWSRVLIQIHILEDKQLRSRSVGFFTGSTLFAKAGHIISLDKNGYQVNIFLISPQKHMLWVLIKRAKPNEYPQHMFLWRNKNIYIIIGFLINMQVQGQHPHQWAPFQLAGLLHAWQISHQISRYVYHEGW